MMSSCRRLAVWSISVTMATVHCSLLTPAICAEWAWLGLWLQARAISMVIFGRRVFPRPAKRWLLAARSSRLQLHSSCVGGGGGHDL